MERFVLIGGGLQAGLAALLIHARRADAHVTIVEQGRRLGGNHTWSFHHGDLYPTAWRDLAGLPEFHWPAYDVRFPNRERTVAGGYYAFSSGHMARLIQETAETSGRIDVRCGVAATAVSAHQAVLADGATIAGDLVVDARGPDRLTYASGEAAYQKFVGLEVELSARSPRATPLLKDACLPQTDGYRFMYMLPFGERRVLIEDTYFSDSPQLDRDAIRAEVIAYAARNGYAIDHVVREEAGVIPLARVRRLPAPSDGVLRAGYGGGWFHPTTGYSLPVAARVAECIAAHGPAVMRTRAWRRLVARHRRQFGYGVFLNKLLYGAYPPYKRRHVFERFYGLPDETIARFYALDLSVWDRIRILSGRPPRGLSLRLALQGGTAT